MECEVDGMCLSWESSLVLDRAVARRKPSFGTQTSRFSRCYLHLMFLDWSKAFDKIRPAALRSALVRLRVPQHMVEVVCELTANPLFEVTMDHEVSQIHE